MHRTAASAQHALRPILDFALPPRCPGCGAVTQEPHRFCLDCWSALTLLAEPPAYDRLRAAVAYGEISRAVALKLKFGGRPGVAETIARFMQRHLDSAGDPLLAPVPLHRWRIWRRRYNQSALIAAALARRAGLAAQLDLVQRVKATPVLRNLSPRERKEAVRGAFRVNPRRNAQVKGRTIILIDDVYTSGATVNACARILRRAGATQVNILCWARVVRGGDH